MIIFHSSIMKTMMPLVVLLAMFFSMTSAQQNITARQSVPCTNDLFCVQGICPANQTICICNRGYTFDRENGIKCTYQKKSKLAAFLLSFFIGGLGADWFYLSAGNAGYIVAGVFKLLTLGGIGIWWLVDWIRILTNAFFDGKGVDLLEWSP